MPPSCSPHRLFFVEETGDGPAARRVLADPDHCVWRSPGYRARLTDKPVQEEASQMSGRETSITRRTLLGAAAATATAAAVPARAQPAGAANWPTRNVRIIVPYPAGGSTDVLTRILAERLKDKLGGPSWVVENRPELEIYMLKWDLGIIESFGRGSTPLVILDWMTDRRMHLKLDGAHVDLRDAVAAVTFDNARQAALVGWHRYE